MVRAHIETLVPKAGLAYEPGGTETSILSFSAKVIGLSKEDEDDVTSAFPLRVSQSLK